MPRTPIDMLAPDRDSLEVIRDRPDFYECFATGTSEHLLSIHSTGMLTPKQYWLSHVTVTSSMTHAPQAINREQL